VLAVRCRGCRRQVGVATDVHNGVYCEPVCTVLPPASANDARDDLIVLLDVFGHDRQSIAEEFQLTKQRVSQVVQKVVS
jgi:hypothetical protein